MWKWVQNLVDTILWVFYKSKDKSLDLSHKGVSKDTDKDKTKGDRV